MLLHDISQLVVGINKVVAGVHIAVVLDRQRRAALGRKDAERLRHAVPRLQRNIEDLHIDAAYILYHPIVKDLLQEFAELQRLNRPFRDGRLLSCIGLQQDQAIGIRLLWRLARR